MSKKYTPKTILKKYRILWPFKVHGDGEDFFLKAFLCYTNILDKMPGSVYCVGKDGKYLWGNDNVIKMLGYKRKEDIIGKTYKDFASKLQWPEKVYKHFEKEDKYVIETGRPIINQEEAPFFDAYGNRWCQLTNKIPIHDEEGNFQLILGVSLDISDRIVLEEKLKEKNQELEDRIIKKHRQFIQNQEHDLRTPTSSLVSAANVLLAETEHLPEEVKRFIKIMALSAEGILKYNDSTLKVLYLSNNIESTICEQLSWKTIVQDMYDMHKASALLKKLDYRLSMDDNIPEYLLGDERKLRGILLNLLSNAFRFTEEGQVLFLVEHFKQEADRIYLRFTVRDTGIGIPKEKQFDIYETFYKVKPSNRGGERGRGLGLSFVKQYVNDMDGELILNSKPDKGSEFRVILPFKVSLDQSPPVI